MTINYHKYYLLFLTWLLTLQLICYSLLFPTNSIANQSKTMTTSAPQRIISLYGGLTETLYALGLAPRIVGVVNSDDYPPDVRSKARVGTHFNPSIEKILSLNPDLVLAKNRRGRTAEALTYLEKAGISIFTADPHTIDDFFTLLKTLGKRFGCQERAARLIRKYRQKLKKEQRKVTSKKRGEKVFFEVRYHDHALIAAGAKSIVNEIIKLAGGINMVTAPRQHVNYNIETLLGKQPDIYIVQRGPMNKSPLPGRRPLFKDLDAVRSGQVFCVDEKKYSRFGPRTIDAIIELTEIIHPEHHQNKIDQLH